MRTNIRSVGLGAILVFVRVLPAWADGGFFWSQATDLSQTRQEAVLAIQADRITYVLRATYEGHPSEFAWVLPIPGTPTDVVAHLDGGLFGTLGDYTRPEFYGFTGGGIGCVCSPTAGRGGVGQIVQVEAQGQAGIYDWAALTSTGSSGLLDWLTANGFAVPASAQPVLDKYIQENMHFLAVRVREPSALTGTAASPPIQFTVNSTRRFYPMVISQVSAAADTEVILYILGAARAEAANVPNGLIDPAALHLDGQSESGTNYEQVFLQTIASLGGLALITEFANSNPLMASHWPEAPAGLLGEDLFLTRMRTVISKDHMTQDFEFRDAAADTPVDRWLTVSTTAQAGLGGAAEPLAALLVFGAFAGLMRRMGEKRRRKKAGG